MKIFRKPHREIEKRHGLDNGVLKEAVKWLLNNKHDLKEVEKGCADYCRKYPEIRFDVAFNLGVSSMKNPPEEKPVTN